MIAGRIIKETRIARCKPGGKAMNRTATAWVSATAALLGLTANAVAGGHAASAGHFSGGHFSAPSHAAFAGHAGFGARAAFSGHAGGFSGIHAAGHAFAGTEPGRSFPRSTFAARSPSGFAGHVAVPAGVQGAVRAPPARIAAAARAPRYWGGGYWHGRLWPHTFYWTGTAWFLAVLPAACVTYWWAGVPYYYYDNAYYVWSPAEEGYVVTDPPPAIGDDSANARGADVDLYAYPKNGQSDELQVQDRRECEQWAGTQAGVDYRRAVAACLEGRGYSVR
jgi:hypothetical protein